jgi:hypothetical protein
MQTQPDSVPTNSVETKLDVLEARMADKMDALDKKIEALHTTMRQQSRACSIL